jgi:hypothetical protein
VASATAAEDNIGRLAANWYTATDVSQGTNREVDFRTMANAKSIGAGKWSTGCFVLFALPFAAVGVGMTYWCAHLVIKHAAMQAWVEVPATIKSAKLKTNHGDDGNTFQAVAEYEYEFAGRKYKGNRVSFGSGSDNVGPFQRNAFNELKRHLDDRKPFRCYVDPQRPSEAVLYRNLRVEMLSFYTGFATLFGSIGLGLIAVAILSARQTPATISKDVPTDQPWLARTDWAAGEIRPSDTAIAPVLGVVALYWNIAALPLYLKLREVIQQGQNLWVWGTLAFPIIGAALVLALAYLLLRARKFGESILQLASTPGVVGGQLAGVVRISKPVVAAEGFRLLLTCVERTSSGDDTREEVLWQDERILMETMRDEASGGTAVPVLFAIPYDCEETSRTESKRNVTWQLKLSAKVPGVNYKSQFEVPVFKTSDSRPDFALDERLSADYATTPNNDYLLGEAGIFKEPLAGDGVRLIFPAARNLGSAIGLTLFTAIWTGAIYVMRHAGAPIIFPIVFGLFGIVMVWIVLDLWLYRSVAEVSRNGLTIRSGLLGIGRRRTFALKEIKNFTTKEYMSSGTNVWKSVIVVPQTGRHRMIGKGIRSKLAVDAVINELNTALGLTTE